MDRDIEGLVIKKIQNSRQYKIGTYSYFVWPYKGITEIAPYELNYLVRQLSPLIPKTTEALFSFVADGELLTVALALHLKLPFIIARDHHYNMSNRVKFTQKTQYFSRPLYFETPKNGRKICIVDVIISSGQTVIGAAKALRRAKTEITGIVSAVSKIEHKGISKIEQEVGLRPQVLFEVMREKGEKLSVKRI